MNSILSLIVHFFTEDTVNNHIKLPVLLLVMIFLLLVLGICVFISRKNMLYVNQKGKNEDISELLKGNEVA
ncbi:MAG: hypothetical protein QM644_22250 [Mobilitalea sp.]